MTNYCQRESDNAKLHTIYALEEISKGQEERKGRKKESNVQGLKSDPGVEEAFSGKR